MTAKRTPEGFAHADFWDSYAKSWEEAVKPGIDGQILGEEWASPEHTRGIFERFAAPYLGPRATVVEIGPGGGKFSRLLIEDCAELILVDISREMLQRANRACGGRARELLVEDGSLQALEPGSVDLVFSYDVFLHLESEEIFRYLSEVNRVLRPSGIFSIHSCTFDSCWGMHSFLQQLGDNLQRIGSRYGGRMYPLSDDILRRFAEHSGFVVADAHASEEDRDILYALRKTRPARPFMFLTTPELRRRFALSERLGGSDRRELYAAQDASSGELLVLAVGAAGDPSLEASALAAVPEHPCLSAPVGRETVAGLDLVRYEAVRGRSLASGSERPSRWSVPRPVQVGRLLEGLLAAHAAGLAHGELGPDFIVADDARQCLRLFGLVQPSPESTGDLRRLDLVAAAQLLEAVAAAGRQPAELSALAEELAREPRAETLEAAVRGLLQQP